MLTGGGSGYNYGAAPVKVEQGDSGEFPGVEAKQLHCLAGALVQRGGVATAAQRSGAGRSWWRRLLGFTAARGMDGMRGSAGRFKGASAGISASAPEFGRPASVSAGIAGSVASARRGGDEAGRRGPRVSGGAHCERAERATRGCADVWRGERLAGLALGEPCGLSG